MDMTSSGRARVEAGWQKVRDDGRVCPLLLEAAYAEPRLRQLFPWTGMGELHFSRCTEWDWTSDIPYIQPAADNSYWVSGPLRTQTVGPAATPEEAVAMVVERLPPGSGPAFAGTPEELAAHEANRSGSADRRAIEHIRGRPMSDAWPPGSMSPGTRVTVIRDPSWNGPWQDEFPGTIDDLGTPEPAQQANAREGELAYWVTFDEPQYESNGDGPYRKAQISEQYLRRERQE
ncbi:DUF6193 family natural product biosynthesis protein [Streptomyces sp. NPDC050617]|uniref:DUF6193 family natural product biosynthesis protein n=1 Tax=Streptomyces sp. NPDC050617 TaxID=3154628 RepID=UPI003422B3A4